MKTCLCSSRVLAFVGALALGHSLHAASFLKNPSFESNYNDTYPHYGTIDDWVSVGGGGVNEAAGPFHNGGTQIPDGNRVAFKQGSGTLAQDITGLTAGKRYWVQFYYDARGCCGGTIDVLVKWNNTELDRIPNVKAASGTNAAYYFRNVAFTPDSDMGTLTLQTVANGDATANFDAITIVQRETNDVVVANPSFEASGPPVNTGLIAPANLAGWLGTGQYGINAAGGALADNGAIPDQDNVAFLQGEGSLSQTVSGLATGATYQVSFAYNAKSGTRPHLQIKVGDAVLSEEDVNPVGGTNPYRTKTVSFTATNTSATITFAQTNAIADVTLLLDQVRVTGQISKEFPPINFDPASSEIGPGQRLTIQVTVPREFLAEQAADLKFSIDRTDRATLLNADTNGVLTLHYDKAGTNVQTLTIEGVARGQARLNAVETAGLKVVQDVKVDVLTSFVRNSSFESSPVPGGVGYGPILSWTGGSGLNTSAGPFADNGLIPDRDQVAFLQGAKTLSQQIVGLSPGKNHWLQFRYNVRNCCGGTINLSVKFEGNELTKIDAIAAAGAQNPYYFTNIAFTPGSASGLLDFTTTATGDATLLLDAISIVQRDAGEIVIENPSFEATGNPVGVGYLGPKKIAGWDVTAGYGINIDGAGPFTDNGDAPDQDRVLLIQGAGMLSQTVTGLTAGQKYTLIYSVNRRTCCGGAMLTHSVSFDNQPLVTDEEVLPVGGTNPYLTKYLTFTNAGTEGVLQFTTQVQGDATLLLDDIHIARGEVKPAGPPLGARLEAGGNVRVAWPATVADYRLQSAPTLTGTWQDVTATVTVEGTDNVVREVIAGASRFYRLIK